MKNFLTGLSAFPNPCDRYGVDSEYCINGSSEILANTTIQSGINFFLIIIGALSVVFIIIGAMRLTASQGSPDRVKTARNTIIFAVIGLAVALLAGVIINLVVFVSGEFNP
jgi:hypothetical protein